MVWETQAEKKIVDGSSRKLAKWKVEFGEVGGTLFAIIIMEKSDEHPQKLREHVMYYKPDNLQYNTLGPWVDGTIVSSTKCLIFQVLFFFNNFL